MTIFKSQINNKYQNILICDNLFNQCHLCAIKKPPIPRGLMVSAFIKFFYPFPASNFAFSTNVINSLLYPSLSSPLLDFAIFKISL